MSWYRSPFSWGLIITIVYFFVLFPILVVWIGDSPFRSLTLNEIGEFLAGAVTPLAFLWLAVAVFLQRSELEALRHELAQSREVLMLQSKELSATSEQVRIQTEIMKEQINERSMEKRRAGYIKSIKDILLEINGFEQKTIRWIQDATNKTDFSFKYEYEQSEKDIEDNTKYYINKAIEYFRNQYISLNSMSSLKFPYGLPVDDIQIFESILERMSSLIDVIGRDTHLVDIIYDYRLSDLLECQRRFLGILESAE